MISSNYHTHSVFCDGKDEPESMVLKAIDLGFSALGFSGHSYNDFDGFGMDEAKESAYMSEINRLKEKYAAQLEIYLGIEQDYLSHQVREGYDYVIGAVHILYKNGEYCVVDNSLAELVSAVERNYGGDRYTLAEDYYASVADVKRKTNCDIIAHFDLITKNNERGLFFDDGEPRYRRAYMSAIEALAPSRPVFEINTGAMARGYRTSPYPSLDILRALREKNLPIMINSDCHDREKLTCGFSLAEELAREAGYRERAVIKGGKLELVEL